MIHAGNLGVAVWYAIAIMAFIWLFGVAGRGIYAAAPYYGDRPLFHSLAVIALVLLVLRLLGII